MKLSFFKAPNDSYSDYTFWRSRHQLYAMYVMLGSLAFALGQIFG
jgi:hypothetical protein